MHDLSIRTRTSSGSGASVNSPTAGVVRTTPFTTMRSSYRCCVAARVDPYGIQIQFTVGLGG